MSESITIPQTVKGAAKSLFQGFTDTFKKIVFPKDDSVLGTLLNRYDPPSLKDQFLNKYDTEPTKSVRYVFWNVCNKVFSPHITSNTF